MKQSISRIAKNKLKSVFKRRPVHCLESGPNHCYYPAKAQEEMLAIHVGNEQLSPPPMGVYPKFISGNRRIQDPHLRRVIPFYINFWFSSMKILERRTPFSFRRSRLFAIGSSFFIYSFNLLSISILSCKTLTTSISLLLFFLKKIKCDFIFEYL
jgi:hypothetical protein